MASEVDMLAITIVSVRGMMFLLRFFMVVCVIGVMFLLHVLVELCKKYKGSRYVLEVRDETKVLGGRSRRSHLDHAASRTV